MLTLTHKILIYLLRKRSPYFTVRDIKENIENISSQTISVFLKKLMNDGIIESSNNSKFLYKVINDKEEFYNLVHIGKYYHKDAVLTGEASLKLQEINDFHLIDTIVFLTGEIRKDYIIKEGNFSIVFKKTKKHNEDEIIEIDGIKLYNKEKSYIDQVDFYRELTKGILEYRIEDERMSTSYFDKDKIFELSKGYHEDTIKVLKKDFE